MTEVSVRRAGFRCRREEGAAAELAICAGTAVDQALVVIGGSYAFGRLDAPRRRTFCYPFACSRSAAGKCRVLHVKHSTARSPVLQSSGQMHDLGTMTAQLWCFRIVWYS